MLKYHIDEDGNYVVTETRMSWTDTRTLNVRYSPDLKRKQVGTDPWRDTTERDAEWFRKYYLPKYKRSGNE